MTPANPGKPPTIVLLAGEFPPMPGGVADYTHSLAMGLAAAGATVHVIAPGSAAPVAAPAPYALHPLPSRFGIRSLRTVDATLRQIPGAPILFLQYVPHSFGYKAMNLPFALWIYRRRKTFRIWTMFHEVEMGYESGQSLKERLAVWTTRRMAGLVIRASRRLLASTEIWTPGIRRHAPHRSTEWFPVPSNMATTCDPAAVRAVRAALGWNATERTLGHFGTYGALLAPLIESALQALCAAVPAAKFLLLGRGAKSFMDEAVRRHPALAGRIAGRDNLSAAEVADHLAACDVLIQPYPDGATTRRGSLMAGMALGRPIVTTDGPHLEPSFTTTTALRIVPCDAASIAAAVAALLNDPSAAAALGARAALLYRSQFAIERTVERLLNDAREVAP